MCSEESKVLQDRQTQLYKLVKAFLVTIVYAAAALTLITHVSQILGVPFYLYAIIGTFSSIIVIFLGLWKEISKEAFLAVISQRSVVLALLTCCLLSVSLCLFSHRYDTDDFDYVPNMIYYMEHPKAPMDFKIHYLDSGAEPFVSYHISTSLPFERAQGIVAYLGRMNYLTVYYLLTPTLVGCMIPLVWFYLISRFSFPPHAAVTGAFFICLSLILLGEQHRSFGNFAFNRSFQGKTVLLALGLPLFGALTIDFFRSPDKRNWLYLFVASVAVVGLSNSASALVPLLALVLSIACSLSYVTTIKALIITTFKYLFTLVYPALYAGSILLFSFSLVSEDSTLNQQWPETFFGHTELVFGGPVVVSFFIIGTIAAIILVQKRERCLLVTWVLLVIMLYLNPLVSPLIIKYVTSPNIYWRVFYLLPFPLVIGLSGAAVASRLEALGTGYRRFILIAAGALLLAANLPSFSSSVFRRETRTKQDTKTRLALPGYKVWRLEYGRQVLDLSPPSGTMLAAPPISHPLSMLTSQYPQICIRTGTIGINAFMSQRGKQNEADYRMTASRFLGGDIDRKGVIASILLIQNYKQIKSVAACRSAAEDNKGYLFYCFGKLGFTEVKVGKDVVVFMKPKSEGQEDKKKDILLLSTEDMLFPSPD